MTRKEKEAYMTATETLGAYEAGLITEAEATEQALVDKLDQLYVQAEGRPRNAANASSASRNIDHRAGYR